MLACRAVPELTEPPLEIESMEKEKYPLCLNLLLAFYIIFKYFYFDHCKQVVIRDSREKLTLSWGKGGYSPPPIEQIFQIKGNKI